MPTPNLNIAYYPANNSENAYCAQFCHCLSAFGQVHGFQFKSLLLWLKSALGAKSYDLTVVNWLENGLLNQQGHISNLCRLKLRLQLWLLRKSSRQLVWVKHNHYPHATHPDARPEVQAYMARFAALFDTIWVHSPPAASAEIHYVPHPLYGPVATRAANIETPYFIAFGRIAPYKNLLALIDHFPSNQRLLIVGPCTDLDYLQVLQARCPAYVEIRAGFLPEADAATLVSGSQGLIVCHQDDSMIVSGAFFFALAQGVRLFALPSPFLHWAQQQLGPDVVNTAEHLSALATHLEAAPPRQAFSTGQVARINDAFSTQAVQAHLARLLPTQE